jgi:hypothetical protein
MTKEGEISDALALDGDELVEAAGTYFGEALGDDPRGQIGDSLVGPLMKVVETAGTYFGGVAGSPSWCLRRKG